MYTKKEDYSWSFLYQFFYFCKLCLDICFISFISLKTSIFIQQFFIADSVELKRFFFLFFMFTHSTWFGLDDNDDDDDCVDDDDASSNKYEIYKQAKSFSSCIT